MARLNLAHGPEKPSSTYAGGGGESWKQEGHKSSDYEASIGPNVERVPHKINIIYHDCLVVHVAIQIPVGIRLSLK